MREISDEGLVENTEESQCCNTNEHHNIMKWSTEDGEEEGTNYSTETRQALAHAIMNRVGVREWKEYDTNK